MAALLGDDDIDAEQQHLKLISKQRDKLSCLGHIKSRLSGEVSVVRLREFALAVERKSLFRVDDLVMRDRLSDLGAVVVGSDGVQLVNLLCVFHVLLNQELTVCKALKVERFKQLRLVSANNEIVGILYSVAFLSLDYHWQVHHRHYMFDCKLVSNSVLILNHPRDPKCGL